MAIRLRTRPRILLLIGILMLSIAAFVVSLLLLTDGSPSSEVRPPPELRDATSTGHDRAAPPSTEAALDMKLAEGEDQPGHADQNPAAPRTNPDGVPPAFAPKTYAEQARWQPTAVPCWRLRGSAPE